MPASSVSTSARGVQQLGPTATKCEICRQDQGCGPHSLRSSDHRSGTEANRVFLDPYTVACRDTCSCVVDETKSRRRDSVIVFHRGCGLGLRRIEPQNHSLSFVRQVGLIRPSTGGSWCRFTSPERGMQAEQGATTISPEARVVEAAAAVGIARRGRSRSRPFRSRLTPCCYELERIGPMRRVAVVWLRGMTAPLGFRAAQTRRYASSSISAATSLCDRGGGAA